ncbi:hypothetical protein AAZV13_05G090200 [Glycine max]|nr:uncharacterized protein LOC100800115 [Glycine max]XP_040871351.1 uncharacterized protein LOC100800115 [Glycine max]|eukprot:XP_006579973.1 uncharacterized protein LOC100800115 isoform X2 [Glycine max]
MDDMVTLCDICGDQGIEEYLAICNKCPDGAEHIYCNDDKLDKLPEGDWWVCEDCRKSPGSPLLNSEFKGQLAKARYFPKQNAEKNIAIYDTRKRKNLGLLSKSGSFDNASSSVKLNGKCSEVVANDLANTPGSNSLKRKYRDMVGAHEIGEFDAMDTRSPGDRILLGGDNYNSGCSDLRQSLDGKKETPEDVKGKMPMKENNNADNGKLPMDQKNNDSLSVASPTSYEEYMELLYWGAVETMATLLWIKRNLV